MLNINQQSVDSRKSISLSASLFSILVLALVISGCNLPGGNKSGEPKGPQAQPTQDMSLLATLTQQALEQESQEPAPSPTATQQSTMTAAPTATSQSSGDPLPSQGSEIKFRLGGTITYLQGEIAAGQAIVYTFDAMGGQTLIAGVSSEDNDVYFEIKGLDDGRVLASFSEEISSLTKVLPSTQTYRITLTSKTDNSYFLTVEIPAVLSLTPGAGPVSVDGYVDVLQDYHPSALTRVRYLLDLDEGTVLNVQLSSPGLKNLTLALIGADDGVPYLRHVVKSDAINNFQVPVSQEYYLDVYNTGGVSTEYDLEIELSP